jgi:hypothetical protein
MRGPGLPWRLLTLAHGPHLPGSLPTSLVWANPCYIPPRQVRLAIGHEKRERSYKHGTVCLGIAGHVARSQDSDSVWSRPRDVTTRGATFEIGFCPGLTVIVQD